LILDESYKVLMSNVKANKLFNQELKGENFLEFVCAAYIDEFCLRAKSVKEKAFTKFDIALCIEDRKTYVTLKINHSKEVFRLVIKDNTIEHEAYEEMEYVSFHDHLTGVYNRRYFFETVKRLDSNNYYPIGLIFADINGLKIVNDAFGHDAGDELIKVVANKLSNSIRVQDILARISGDEFVIALPNTNASTTEKIIERIKESISIERVKDTKVSVAFGFSVKTDEDQELNKLLTLAETKMYEDKMFKRSSYRKCTIEGLLEKLFSTHEIERTHAENVATYALMIGSGLNYSKDKMEQLRLASLLHDIGKIALDYTLIEKESKLSQIEFGLIKEHSAIGYRILSSASIFGDIPEIVLSHHERVDGKGYPRGLEDNEIIEEAKIIAIADAFDAMTSERSYQATRSKEEAIAELIRYKGTQFDSKMVELFIEEVMK
jgi:diguanylate cyclase (GGDEF)-like protein